MTDRIYILKLAPEQHEIAERSLGLHTRFCLVARTIGDCHTSLEMETLELTRGI